MWRLYGTKQFQQVATTRRRNSLQIAVIDLTKEVSSGHSAGKNDLSVWLFCSIDRTVAATLGVEPISRNRSWPFSGELGTVTACPRAAIGATEDRKPRRRSVRLWWPKIPPLSPLPLVVLVLLTSGGLNYGGNIEELRDHSISADARSVRTSVFGTIEQLSLRTTSP
jgi:hypothetical protein